MKEYSNMSAIDEKYPHIKYVDGENLNIEFHIRRIIEMCWNDFDKYRTVGDIAVAMNFSEREIFRRAKIYGLPNRAALLRAHNEAIRKKIIKRHQYGTVSR